MNGSVDSEGACGCRVSVGTVFGGRRAYVKNAEDVQEPRYAHSRPVASEPDGDFVEWRWSRCWVSRIDAVRYREGCSNKLLNCCPRILNANHEQPVDDAGISTACCWPVLVLAHRVKSRAGVYLRKCAIEDRPPPVPRRVCLAWSVHPSFTQGAIPML